MIGDRILSSDAPSSQINTSKGILQIRIWIHIVTFLAYTHKHRYTHTHKHNRKHTNTQPGGPLLEFLKGPRVYWSRDFRDGTCRSRAPIITIVRRFYSSLRPPKKRENINKHFGRIISPCKSSSTNFMRFGPERKSRTSFVDALWVLDTKPLYDQHFPLTPCLPHSLSPSHLQQSSQPMGGEEKVELSDK